MARKAQLRRRLRELAEQDEEGRRELGALVLQMYRARELDERALGERADRLAGLQDEMAEVREGLEKKPSPEQEDEAQAQERLGYGAAERVPAKPEPEEEPPSAEQEPPSAEQPVPELEHPPDGGDATAEIDALAADLEQERERATDALAQLRAELEDAQRRAAAAEEERRHAEAEARSAAAQWLRGQAEAMRREAERQVREGLETSAPDREQVEAARRAEDRFAAELAAREEEIAQERDAKARALETAERRLAEIEQHAEAAGQRLRETELGAREAAAAWLRGQVEDIRREAESRIVARLEEAPPVEPGVEPPRGKVSLASATVEQLRGLGLSESLATRVIAYRERLGGYETVDDLDAVPGLERDLLTEMKSKLEV